MFAHGWIVATKVVRSEQTKILKFHGDIVLETIDNNRVSKG